MNNQVLIKIMDVEVKNGVTSTKKPYEFLEVAYKNQSFQDKPEVKKVMPFGSKVVFDMLKGAVKGNVFTITREKNDAGFWDWISIQEGEGEVMPQSAKPDIASSPTKGTWETAEERANKQLFIIRQSCLAQAVNTIAIGAKTGQAADLGEILSKAQVFVDFVTGCGVTISDDIHEDIPY